MGNLSAGHNWCKNRDLGVRARNWKYERAVERPREYVYQYMSIRVPEESWGAVFALKCTFSRDWRKTWVEIEKSTVTDKNKSISYIEVRLQNLKNTDKLLKSPQRKEKLPTEEQQLAWQQTSHQQQQLPGDNEEVSWKCWGRGTVNLESLHSAKLALRSEDGTQACSNIQKEEGLVHTDTSWKKYCKCELY